MIAQLGPNPDAPFPAVETAAQQPDGLLAWGGDLRAERLLNAYARGIFPWYSERDPILWWSPAQRCVIPTSRIHVARRLQRTLRQGRFRVSMDTDFVAVIDGCIQSRESTWIVPEMRHAYVRLHNLGHAHSVEVWHGDELAGGLYGVALGRMFFAESMFSAIRDASKVALVTLCHRLADWGLPLLDCQFSNEHLRLMGAELIPRRQFVETVAQLADRPALPGPWTERCNPGAQHA